MAGNVPQDDHSPTVSDLVAHFQLRRRASTDAFRRGLRLTQLGWVTITDFGPVRIVAEVRDPAPFEVELFVDRGSLEGRCPCPAALNNVCEHQVAVAHLVWMRGLRSPSVRDMRDVQS